MVPCSMLVRRFKAMAVGAGKLETKIVPFVCFQVLPVCLLRFLLITSHSAPSKNHVFVFFSRFFLQVFSHNFLITVIDLFFISFYAPPPPLKMSYIFCFCFFILLSSIFSKLFISYYFLFFIPFCPPLPPLSTPQKHYPPPR